MTATVARHEYRSYLRDGRFRWVAGLTLALLLFAALTGWSHRAQLVRERSVATESEQHRWIHQGEKWAHSAAHYGYYVFKPLNALASLDHGIEPYVGVGLWLEAHNQNDFIHRPAEDATALQRFGELTAALVLQLLLPLCIVLLGFGAFTAERESGTLRQLLSVGAPPAALARGKALGAAAAFATVLLPASCLGAAALIASGDGGQPLARFAVLAVAYVLYLGAFVAITLGVSARAPSSRFALVVLLAFWGFNGLLAPRAAAELAARLHPTPPTQEFKRELYAELGDPHDYAEMQRKKQALLRQYGVTDEKDLPVNWTGISLQMGEERGNAVYDRHFGALFGTYRAQNRVAMLLGAVAPLLATQAASLAFAGTDFEHHRHFLAAAENQRRYIQKVLNDDLAAKPDINGQRQMTGSDVYEQVAHLDYALPGPSFALRHAWPALALLAAWFFTTAFWAVRSASSLTA
jgi:ABC-2 type transport system permease protein